jgi:hypothetical protein
MSSHKAVNKLVVVVVVVVLKNSVRIAERVHIS